MELIGAGLSYWPILRLIGLVGKGQLRTPKWGFSFFFWVISFIVLISQETKNVYKMLLLMGNGTSIVVE